MKPMLKGWEEYKKLVLPPNASKIQVEETYKAFMAGALHMYAEIMKNTDGKEADAIDFLDSVQAELREYVATFKSIPISTQN